MAAASARAGPGPRGAGCEPRVGEEADSFDVVVELFAGEGADDGRDVAEAAVGVLFGEVDFDVEFDFEAQRRGVDEDFVWGDGRAE